MDARVVEVAQVATLRRGVAIGDPCVRDGHRRVCGELLIAPVFVHAVEPTRMSLPGELIKRAATSSRWNPEQLFLASIANCPMLWFLHLATQAGIVVVDYRDSPTATMTENGDGSGEFTSVTLRPHVTITAASDPAVAESLHNDVARFCFIARSVNVPIEHVPTVVSVD